MLRRKLHTAVLLIAIVVLGSLSACDSSDTPVTVFLLDISRTVRNFDAAREAWNQVVDRAQDSEVIIFAVVKGDATQTQGLFPYFHKVEMPYYTIFKSKNDYDTERTKKIKELTGLFDDALKLERPKTTLLLNSLRSVAAVMAEYQGLRKLIIYTDGLEDSDIARFEKTTLSDDVPRHLIQNELPRETRDELKGASIHVINSGIASEKKYQEVRTFWIAYFTAAGANFPEHHYADRLTDYH